MDRYQVCPRKFSDKYSAVILILSIFCYLSGFNLTCKINSFAVRSKTQWTIIEFITAIALNLQRFSETRGVFLFCQVNIIKTPAIKRSTITNAAEPPVGTEYYAILYNNR